MKEFFGNIGNRISELVGKMYENNPNASVSFYIILGGLAFFLITLMIYIIVKDKKHKINKAIATETKEEEINVVSDDALKKETEIKEEVIKEDEPLSETQIFNDLLMKKEEPTVTEEEDINQVYLVKEDEKADEEKQDDEVFKEVIDDAAINEINEDKLEFEDTSLDTDGFLNNDNHTISFDDVKNEEKTSRDEEEVVISDDDLKARLEKLKSKQQQETKEELENIMKNMGLEDTMVIPNLKIDEIEKGKNI